MRGLLSGCFAAFWMQFAMNLSGKAARERPEPAPVAPAQTPEPGQSAEDQARVDRILARCKAADEAAQAHSPEMVARWVEFVSQANLPLVVISRNRAVVPSLIPAPQRVH